MMVLGTHGDPRNGDARLAEAKWIADYAGDFPNTPANAVLLCDGNMPSHDWDTAAPPNLQARYRLVNDDGSFGPTDHRAMRVLMQAGWRDPQDELPQKRTATVGYKYENEPTPLHLDHALITGPDLVPTAYVTIDTPRARAISDHLPAVLDTA